MIKMQALAVIFLEDRLMGVTGVRLLRFPCKMARIKPLRPEILLYSLILLVELADELFNLGDAALEYQISIIGFALGDLAGDGGQH